MMTPQQDDLVWAEQQLMLLRADRLRELDTAGLRELLEDRIATLRQELQTLLRQSCVLLLRLHHRPPADGDAHAQLLEHLAELQSRAETLLETAPSLRALAPESLTRAWPQACRIALAGATARGAQIDLPSACPYTLQQLLNAVPAGPG